MNYEVFADKEYSSDWRVEAIEEDSGDIFVAVFSGPEAEERAKDYANYKSSAGVSPDSEHTENIAESSGRPQERGISAE